MNIEKYKSDTKHENFEKDVFVATFKDQIKKNGKRARDDILDVYKDVYPSNTTNFKHTEWRRRSDVGIYLFDHISQNALVLIPENKSDIILLPPTSLRRKGKKLKIKQLKNISKDVPSLSKDVIICILKYLKPWEVLTFRTVCKKWNKWIITEESFWKINKEIPYEPEEWKSLPSYRRYIKNLFINIEKPRNVYKMFTENAKFFYSIAKKSTFMRWMNYYVTNRGIYQERKFIKLSCFLAPHQADLLE